MRFRGHAGPLPRRATRAPRLATDVLGGVGRHEERFGHDFDRDCSAGAPVARGVHARRLAVPNLAAQLVAVAKVAREAEAQLADGRRHG